MKIESGSVKQKIDFLIGLDRHSDSGFQKCEDKELKSRTFIIISNNSKRFDLICKKVKKKARTS